MKVLQSSNITPFGGINFVLEEFNRLGIDDMINTELPALATPGYFGQTVPPFSVKPCHFERCCNDTKY